MNYLFCLLRKHFALRSCIWQISHSRHVTNGTVPSKYTKANYNAYNRMKSQINLYKFRFFDRLFSSVLTVLNLIYHVYVSRPTRCTNSYNVSLFIIKCSTCFGLFSPSSGATFWSCISQWV